jgi:FAD/FMN-containing dehydrogenase
MTSMAFEDGPFQAKGCPSCSQTTTTRAVLGAGCQFGSIYAFLDQYNHTIVGGASMTVGLGGYLTGGGHGLLAPDHGLGADQIVEVEMVTPQGNIVILNECQNQDLFWAIRGVSSHALEKKAQECG